MQRGTPPEMSLRRSSHTPNLQLAIKNVRGLLPDSLLSYGTGRFARNDSGGEGDGGFIRAVLAMNEL